MIESIEQPLSQGLRHSGWPVLARRAFWSVMLGVHLVVLPSACEGLGAMFAEGGCISTPLRVAALLLSSVFFALKIADVPWLRLLPGRRSMIASLVVASLLHVNVLERAYGAEVSRAYARAGMTVLLGTCFDHETVRRALARVARLVRSWAQSAGGHDSLPFIWAGFREEPDGPYPALTPILAVPRAPPISW